MLFPSTRQFPTWVGAAAHPVLHTTGFAPACLSPLLCSSLRSMEGTSTGPLAPAGQKMAPPAGKVTLNVGGTRFEVYCSTLQAFPGTKLCSITEPQADTKFDYNPDSREFFIDRSAKVFGQVLDYCRSRHLHCPAHICRSVLEEELEFWEIPQSPLAPCCLSKLVPLGCQEDKDGPRDATEQDGSQGRLAPDRGRNGSWWLRWKPKLWDAFDKPYSSCWATSLMVFSLLINLALIILLCTPNGDVNYIDDPINNMYNITTIISEREKSYLLPVELSFILWFAFEFLVRLISCPDMKKFLRDPMNAIDFLSLFPVFIDFISPRDPYENSTLVGCLGLFRVLYVIKLLKIFTILEAPLMMRILPFTFRCLLKEIFILLIFLIFEILFFGALLFFVEELNGDPYHHFPGMLASFWWSVVTLTTVGYGDMYPVSLPGRIVGSLTALFGVLSIISPIAMFFTKFKHYYDAALIREKKKKKKWRRGGESVPLS